jgi:hypothetical protein
MQTRLVSAPNTSNHILVNTTIQTGLVSAPNTFNHILVNTTMLTGLVSAPLHLIIFARLLFFKHE